MIYVGIDPGYHGGIAALDSYAEKPFLLEATPIIETKFTKKGKTKSKIAGYNEPVMNEILKTIKSHGPVHVLLEWARAFPGQGSVSMFNIGVGFGLWRGLLAANEMRYTLVTPKKWQEEMFDGTPASPDVKGRAALAVIRLFPGVDLRISEKGKKPHEGKVDALLIADYGRRRYSTAPPDFYKRKPVRKKKIL